ncbi:MAG: hypothetical protein UY92_C0004G0030 [Candidatus Magasanikbacteria bacterium GW2011_GWA2_56_11]|uniref:Uncharacterized protein n=1 Tax=Candidatus Magasanikbacteria bacterium GW2011_GWA2_56_11 TaxID=1619044 RepID=A0A0G2BB10_9BACT|nr:MAG: hypothetical protein UY92_C0004G0030 [Candidatus Magasanikbacteria bacterium GW2011_GWA2_56_11]
MSVADRIGKKIHDERLTPSPRWHTAASRAALYTLAALVLILGAVAIAVTWYIVEHFDAEMARYSRRGFAAEWLLALPYVWIGLFVLIAVLLVVQIRHVGRGYRLRLSFLATAAVIISLATGAILRSAGVGDVVDSSLVEAVPGYRAAGSLQERHWLRPGDGLLAGVVHERLAGQEFVLKDVSGRQWRVIVVSSTMPQRFIPPTGSRVRVAGELLDEDRFRAYFIRPLMPGKRRFMHRLLERPPQGNLPAHLSP